VREVLIVAGEVSGDLHAAAFATALRARRPDVALAGIGSVRMEAAGVTLIERSEHLQAMGLVEVIGSVPHHWQLLRTLRARLQSGTVALLVVLDYPGFNLKLAAAAHDAGVPVLYFITPQVWAWGAGRIPEIKRVVTKAAVILPFEEPLLRNAGIDATFVGHPLLDRAADLPDRAEARRRLGLAPDARVLALFPGSRGQEIARHLDIFVAAGKLLEQRIPGLEIIVSVAPGMTIDTARCPWPQVAQRSYDVLRAADAALCKSGTTTLEAALAECPLLIAYRTNPITAFLARRLMKVPHVGLVNVVAGREIVKEYLQQFMTAEALADGMAPLLDLASPERARMLADLRAVRASLGEPGAAERVAAMADGMLG
jgi:lipid-A-disaccharide synthase